MKYKFAYLLMFLVIVGAIFMVATTATQAHPKRDELDVAKSKASSVLQSLPEGACFREVYGIVAKQPWEVSYINKSHAFLLVKKSDNAVLIAQPSAHDEDEDEGPKTHYWLRTVDLDDVFFIGLQQSECPKYLTLDFIKDYAKKHNKGAVRL